MDKFHGLFGGFFFVLKTLEIRGVISSSARQPVSPLCSTCIVQKVNTQAEIYNSLEK